MHDSLTPEARAHLEEAAALGYLLNAIAHDLNNQLTNLLLGADQAQYTGSKEAIELVVQQANRLAAITRAVQQLGQANMDKGKGSVDLATCCAEAAAWSRGAGRPCEAGAVEAGLRVQGGQRHLSMAFGLIARWVGEQAPGQAVSICAGLEQVPRSSWSGSTETVPRAVVRIAAGDAGDGDVPGFKALVDDFFAETRDATEVGLMAAWEVLRKVRGRVSVRGAPGAAVEARIALVPEP